MFLNDVYTLIGLWMSNYHALFLIENVRSGDFEWSWSREVNFLTMNMCAIRSKFDLQNINLLEIQSDRSFWNGTQYLEFKILWRWVIEDCADFILLPCFDLANCHLFAGLGSWGST